MITELTGVTASAVAAEISRQRRRQGSAAGMALTLVIPTDERNQHDAVQAATEAGMEHPCRVLVVIPRAAKSAARLDAEVRVGGSAGPGETVVLRLYGPLGQHADSVVLPLLLPDAPVVAWWPGIPPPVPAATPLGGLARRRVTDAAATPRTEATLAALAKAYSPGDTDLAWTRLSPWRTLLAAALDHPTERITAAEVAAARGNASAQLLCAWLTVRLGVPVTARASRGPGITEVRLTTARGDIALTRPDGVRAVLSRPGQPDRGVALARRRTSDLIAEELRRLDADEPYAETLAALPKRAAAGKKAASR
ncbi:MAG TPA: glucose-6-phosphate dehydrogenase assembly protein OpcA [Mycobacteriales bacterium]|nr:glucose-6-phosphate dehydrogenase assembly protein OpcA [Mycobacteriales bacterium]